VRSTFLAYVSSSSTATSGSLSTIGARCSPGSCATSSFRFVSPRAPSRACVARRATPFRRAVNTTALWIAPGAMTSPFLDSARMGTSPSTSRRPIRIRRARPGRHRGQRRECRSLLGLAHGGASARDHDRAAASDRRAARAARRARRSQARCARAGARRRGRSDYPGLLPEPVGRRYVLDRSPDALMTRLPRRSRGRRQAGSQRRRAQMPRRDVWDILAATWRPSPTTTSPSASATSSR
jgi:hypothetical protein